ncbi:DUF6300 family protein [Streptomyces sp. SBC-4]|nr:DUF6300 family protein [Streptomyces sp. SBC-4]MDV5143181.1 DUF6300 family protein [Streptomyces sp. SBC-4]
MAPEDDEHGRPIHLELCAVCDTGDADHPAAGFLVQWFTAAAPRTRAAPRRARTC